MKGILFTELLFNKTIARQKTQTRREGSLKLINERPDDWGIDTIAGDGSYWFVSETETGYDLELLKPRYNVGEVCYIKEPYILYQTLDYIVTSDGRSFSEISDGMIGYKYDGHDTVDDFREYIRLMSDGRSKEVFTNEDRFKNKLFMGEKYARYYIKITGVKVERLFDISKEDVIAEGVDHNEDYDYISPGGYLDATNYKDYSSGEYIEDHLESYLSLFRFANKIPKSKEIQNIWCFCYSYFLCDKLGNPI